MRSLYKHQVELLRFSNLGDYNDDGEWIDGAPVRDPCQSFRCLVQPPIRVPGTIQEHMDDAGLSIKDLKLIFSPKELFTASEQEGRSADVIGYRGSFYEVFESSLFDGLSRIVAWEVLAIRKDGIIDL